MTAAGGKYWRFKYYYGHTIDQHGKRKPKEKRLAIGVYPEVSLKQARDARDRARQLLAENKDPSQQKKIEKLKAVENAGNTFSVMAATWLKKNRPTWAPRYTASIKGRLENHILPWIGGMPIADIEKSMCEPLLERLVNAHKAESARRCAQIIRSVFDYAESRNAAKAYQLGNLNDFLPKKVVKHHAALIDPEQVGPILRTLDGYKGSLSVAAALRLMPLLVVRPGELRQAEWSEINLDKRGMDYSRPQNEGAYG